MKMSLWVTSLTSSDWCGNLSMLIFQTAQRSGCCKLALCINQEDHWEHNNILYLGYLPGSPILYWAWRISVSNTANGVPSECHWARAGKVLWIVQQSTSFTFCLIAPKKSTPVPATQPPQWTDKFIWRYHLWYPWLRDCQHSCSYKFSSPEACQNRTSDFWGIWFSANPGQKEVKVEHVPESKPRILGEKVWRMDPDLKGSMEAPKCELFLLSKQCSTHHMKDLSLKEDENAQYYQEVLDILREMRQVGPGVYEQEGWQVAVKVSQHKIRMIPI